jgi:hypothetical protein
VEGGNNMKNVWLAHHGIVGQKWGVRRFQNKDGSLTSAGKQRYNKIGSANFEKATYDIEKRKAELLDKGLIKSSSLITDKESKRADEAAEIGIAARNKIGYDGGNPKDKSNQAWYKYEDQTIGDLYVADMVNMGYPKKDLINTLKYYHDYRDQIKGDAAWEMNYFYDYWMNDSEEGNKYIDAMYESLEERKK